METWGRFVFRHRWWVLLASIAAALAGIGLILTGGDLNNDNTFDFESAHALNLMTEQLPNPTEIDFVLSSSTLVASDKAFQQAAEAAMAPVRHEPHVIGVTMPWQLPPAVAALRTSFDHHRVIVTVSLNEDFAAARGQYLSLRDVIHSPTLSILPSSEAAVAAAFDHYSETDITRAESVSLPAALLLLVLVFGTLVASLICLGVGAVAVTSGTGIALALSHFTNVSPYAIEVVSLIGLGVAIDYSLFIVSRFREELRKTGNVEDALAITMATAGKAIFFSGLTVAIGLSGLLFYHGIFLVSLGFAGALVVGMSVAYAMTFLPALLAVLGPKVNRLKVPGLRTDGKNRAWHTIALMVMRHPIVVLIPVVAILLLSASPLPNLRIVESDVQQLPAQAEARQGAEAVAHDFPGQSITTFNVVIQFAHGKPTDSANVRIAYELAARYRHVAHIQSVDSYVTAIPNAALSEYEQIYAGVPSAYPAVLGEKVHDLTGRNIAVLNAKSTLDSQSTQAQETVTALRQMSAVSGATVYVDGETAFSKDFVDFIGAHTPAAIIFVMVITVLVLLVLFRSVVLPFKAVLMNLVSLSAALGVMVWSIQQGHLSSILDFTAAPIDPTLPVLMFCLVFGLSMDYEVFLLTRMREAYLRHGDNTEAVAEGLEASGRLITGAAAIMVAVFAAFAFLAQEVVIKAIGLGMATAVLVDATLVRGLVVPALMRLLGRANWWAPRWLLRLLPGR
jgi:putative drug exporter of the RND superfamily